MSSPTLWICPRSPVCTVSLRIALYMFWLNIFEGTWRRFVSFHRVPRRYLARSSFSHLLHSNFFPRSLSNFCRKRRWIQVLVRLRKRSVGPKRQERSRGRERRLCDVTGKAIKGQSVGRGSGRKGGGEQERLRWISWILCICYLITGKSLKVTDYHKGKLFPSHVDPDM